LRGARHAMPRPEPTGATSGARALGLAPRPGSSLVVITGPKIDVHLPDVVLYGQGGGGLAAPSGSVSRIIAAIDPEGSFRRIMAAVPETGEGISAADRARREREIAAEILRLEHVEEALVVRALAAGLEVHRRPDASGWALLGLTATARPVEAPPMAEAAE
jgi:hypothetical protein